MRGRRPLAQGSPRPPGRHAPPAPAGSGPHVPKGEAPLGTQGSLPPPGWGKRSVGGLMQVLELIHGAGCVCVCVCCLVLGACCVARGALRLVLDAWRLVRDAWYLVHCVWCWVSKETGRFDLRQEEWQRRRRGESRPRTPVHLRAQMRTLLSPARGGGAHPPNPSQCSLSVVLWLGAWMLGAWCSVLSAWCLVLGVWRWFYRLVHCAQCFVHSLRRHGSHGPSLSGGPRGAPPDTTPPSASARQTPKQTADVLGGWCLVFGVICKEPLERKDRRWSGGPGLSGGPKRAQLDTTPPSPFARPTSKLFVGWNGGKCLALSVA